MEQQVKGLIEEMANLPVSQETLNRRYNIIRILSTEYGIEMHAYPNEKERWRREQWRDENGFVAYVGPEGSARAKSLD